MIIPLNATPAYREALKVAFERYSIAERSPGEQEAFCRAFQAGWEASKRHTMEILISINQEDPDK